MRFYINGLEAEASRQVSYYLRKCILHQRRPWTELIFLCIGTDRVPGDSLGPCVGHQLSKYTLPCTTVYGTLQDPVHALNLDRISRTIRKNHPAPLVIAIDASLGTKKHLGYVTIENGSLCPGAGVQKKLAPVGDIAITGIVNLSGVLEQFALQTTRLSTIMIMADAITEGILTALPQCSSRMESSLEG